MLPSYYLPSSTPDTLFSFANHPVTARSRLHASLRTSSWTPPSAASTSSKPNTTRNELFPPSTPHSTTSPHSASHCANPTTSHPTNPELTSRRRLTTRARHRALRGLQPSGAALHLLAADLSDDERGLGDEQEELNNFGRRFLIPIGRRNTQMEAEAAPSPTPSDHDHRQEDRQGISPSPEPLEDVDLDASVDDHDAPDLDASLEDLDRSTEYDSDDLRLMREMDRSLGSDGEEDMDDDE